MISNTPKTANANRKEAVAQESRTNSADFQRKSRASLNQPIVAQDKEGIGSGVAGSVNRDHKSAILAQDSRTMATVAARFILIVVALGIAGYLLRFIWTGLLPVLLALLMTTALYPVTAWIRTRLRFPAALAAVSTLLVFFGVIGGIFTAMAPTVRRQGAELISQAEGGIAQLGGMLDQLPIDIEGDQVQNALQDLTNVVKGQASNIATGVMTGVSTASSIIVCVVIMFFLSFFFIKEGERFLPWLRKYTGATAGWHITELCNRIWKTLSGFIQAQAAVAMVDAVFIGLGLWVLQVPLAFVIAVITFFGGFIPIIGAVVAGALAVIIALVSKGLTTALLALLVVIAVQQLESNVLQPILQSKAMGLHATVVLLSVTVGSALAGIIGAFLAVPVAATISVVLRYGALTTALRAGEVDPYTAEIITGAPKASRRDRKADKESDFADEAARTLREGATDVAELDPNSPRGKIRELYIAMSPKHWQAPEPPAESADAGPADAAAAAAGPAGAGSAGPAGAAGAEGSDAAR
ncbi:AI-2E family transporter [Corynebacterium lizhenjunii]|nr:AI-2E family transporter [Corynebacterium lizhenjunii]